MITEPFNYPDLESDPPKPLDPKGLDGDGYPRTFSYKPFDDSKDSPENENAPRCPRIDDPGEDGGMDTPAADSAVDDDDAGSPDRSADVLPPDQWEFALSKGNYDLVGQAVVQELRDLGGSEAEVATAANLCNLASEKRDDPAWVQWSRDMLKWVLSLRG